MIKYRYFINYSWSGKDENGSGMTEFFTNKKIDSYDDVVYVSEKIKEKNNFETVIICNWKLLRIEKE